MRQGLRVGRRHAVLVAPIRVRARDGLKDSGQGQALGFGGVGLIGLV